MRQLILVAALAALCGTAQAQQWAQRPSDEEFEQHYPVEAALQALKALSSLLA